MAKSVKHMLGPVTPAPAFIITADVGRPPLITSPNVYPVAPDDGSSEVEEQWQILGSVEGTDPESAIIEVILWPFLLHGGLSYPVATFEVVGVDKLDKVTGNIQDLPGILGCIAMGVQVDGLTGDHELHLVHTQR